MNRKASAAGQNISHVLAADHAGNPGRVPTPSRVGLRLAKPACAQRDPSRPAALLLGYIASAMRPRRALPAGRLVTQNMTAILTGGTRRNSLLSGQLSLGDWLLLQSVVAFLACTSSPIRSRQTPDAGDSGYNWVLDLQLEPTPQLDLVFILDNSPSMGPKRDKLKTQLPRLVDAMRFSCNGASPALRIAILDSDLGTSGAITSGACGPKNGTT